MGNDGIKEVKFSPVKILKKGEKESRRHKLFNRSGKSTIRVV